MVAYIFTVKWAWCGGPLLSAEKSRLPHCRTAAHSARDKDAADVCDQRCPGVSYRRCGGSKWIVA